MDGHPHRASGGFTLIELLVALLVIGILTSASVAGYRQYLQRANRVDATAALLRLQAAEERFYLQNSRYAGNDELALAPPAGLGLNGTEHGYYLLEITPADAGLAVGYTATATARPDGPQADDNECRVLIVDQSGRQSARNAAGSGGAAVTARCWR